MKRFQPKRQKAASIESRFDSIKPRPPGPTKLTTKQKQDILKMWGREMGAFFVKINEDSMKKLVCKTQAEYKKRLAQWKKERAAAIAEREASMKRQQEDDRNRYYACSRCGTEACFDGRDAWQSCDHNDRFIQQRDRRQSYNDGEYYR